MIDLTYQYDEFMGQYGKAVCVGQCALWRAGLTTAHMSYLQLGTLYPEINGCGSWKAMFYFDPWATQYFETSPSPASENILQPTKERALIETMLLHENFNEGVLIESMKDYLYYHDDLSRLFGVQRMFGNYSQFKEMVKYWIKEAEEDIDD